MTDAGISAAQAGAGMAADAPRPVPIPSGQPEYVGLVTRAIAIVIDVVLINTVAVVTAAAAGLLMATLSFPEDIEQAAMVIGGFVYSGWVVLYFVALWAVNAQTFGARIMGFRVQHPGGGRMRPRTALVRFAAMVLAALPLGAGFLPVLYNDRRRGLHDRIADTVVVVGEGDHPPHGRLGAAASGAATVTR